MGYRGISEAEAERRRGKFGKPKRGGFRGMEGRECDEDEIKRRNQIESEVSDSSEGNEANSSSDSSEETNSSEESNSDNSTDSNNSSDSDNSTDSNNSSDSADSDDSLEENQNRKLQPDSEGEESDGSESGKVSKAQLRRDMARLAVIKKQREEAARKRQQS